MTRLVSVSDLVRDHNYDLSGDYYDPEGDSAYGMNGEKIGKVVDALAEDGGKLRYLVLDVGSWFTSKLVLVPVGLARFDEADHAVYFDNLTRDQVRDMRQYERGLAYDYADQVADERVLRGTGYTGDIGYVGGSDATYNYRDDLADDTLYKTPGRLQLLEERLMVNKERYQAGSVTIGKRVETHQENVGVDLSHDEVVIERRPVTEVRPVEGNVTLGAATETVRVDLEAERANVQKQAYVTEEVEVGKRTETERQTFSDTVGKEVLEVNKTGEVEVTGDTTTGTTTTDPDLNRR